MRILYNFFLLTKAVINSWPIHVKKNNGIYDHNFDVHWPAL